LGELIEMLMQDGIAIPSSLGKFAADVFRGRSLKSKRGRPKFGNLGRDSIIHECVAIAGEYVRPYYQDDAAITAVVIVSWCLPDYGLDDDAMGVEGITRVFKKYESIQSGRTV
ncbi:hypothetical protein, partial [Halomonas halophila]|uniref:hypothetical protein n=2 Tax=Halomonadaceae TaxID=28256 RepID=UPI001C99FB06